MYKGNEKLSMSGCIYIIGRTMSGHNQKEAREKERVILAVRYPKEACIKKAIQLIHIHTHFQKLNQG